MTGIIIFSLFGGFNIEAYEMPMQGFYNLGKAPNVL